MKRILTPPPKEALDFIRENYTYDPLTGVVSRGGKRMGSRDKSNGGYVRIAIFYKESTVIKRTAHQIGWFLTYGEWPILYIDHIDGHTANNRLDNLRLVDLQQNAHNQKKAKRHPSKKKFSSQYKGVCYDRAKKQWRAQINLGGGTHHIKWCATEWEAAKVYDDAMLAHDPTHSCLNLSGENTAISRLTDGEGAQDRYFLGSL